MFYRFLELWKNKLNRKKLLFLSIKLKKIINEIMVKKFFNILVNI